MIDYQDDDVTRTGQFPELEAQARGIGESIGRALEEAESKVGYRVGFALLLFGFAPERSLTWISNAERESMLTALEEFLDKNGQLESIVRAAVEQALRTTGAGLDERVQKAVRLTLETRRSAFR